MCICKGYTNIGRTEEMSNDRISSTPILKSLVKCGRTSKKKKRGYQALHWAGHFSIEAAHSKAHDWSKSCLERVASLSELMTWTASQVVWERRCCYPTYNHQNPLCWPMKRQIATVLFSFPELNGGPGGEDNNKEHVLAVWYSAQCQHSK